jgi:hypothetical protein
MSDAERWDVKHTAAAGTPLQAPDAFLVSVLDELELLQANAAEAGVRAVDSMETEGRAGWSGRRVLNS